MFSAITKWKLKSSQYKKDLRIAQLLRDANQYSQIQFINDIVIDDGVKRFKLMDNELVRMNDYFSSTMIRRGEIVICVKPRDARTPNEFAMEVGNTFKLIRIFQITKKMSLSEFKIDDDCEEEDVIVGMGIKLNDHLEINNRGDLIALSNEDKRSDEIIELNSENIIKFKEYIKFFPMDNVTIDWEIVKAALNNEDLNLAMERQLLFDYLSD